MSGGYDISKNSDIDKLIRDLTQDARKIAVNEMHQRKYDLSCPKCKAAISLPPGLGRCPLCGNEIDPQLDIDFKG